MLELTTANAIDYLRARSWIGAGPAEVEYLGGGVSNVVLRVVTPQRRFVLKQSRTQLRTKAAWFSDLERIYREQEVMEALGPLLPPGTVPDVLHVDRENYVFAMSHAPDGACVWKEQLLAGVIDSAVAEHAGRVLGRMHQATAGRQDIAARFADPTVFGQLRVDPFYRTVQQRHPDLAAVIEPIVQGLLTIKEAICHGDYTPKNILTHEHGFTLVDYETAYYGDPMMDVGLFLAHLLLKAFRPGADRRALYDLVRVVWRGYTAEVCYRPAADLEARGIAHCAVCLLARIDGTSPVDYLPAESARAAVRQMARQVLIEKPPRWEEIMARMDRIIS